MKIATNIFHHVNWAIFLSAPALSLSLLILLAFYLAFGPFVSLWNMILQMFCKIFALFEWRKKRAECIECVVEFQRVNHFTDHLSNNSKIVELWLFSSHFHFTYLFLSQFHAINIANGNWWQPRSLWKHFVLYVLILAFVFILGQYFRNHVPFNSMHSLLSISSMAMHRYRNRDTHTNTRSE